MKTEHVAAIFDPEPDQWGLRGDPFLWDYLKDYYQAAELPYPIETFREEVLRIFADLAGAFPMQGEQYYVEQFAKKYMGMSTGWLSGDFWQNVAIPMLLERLNRINTVRKKCGP